MLSVERRLTSRFAESSLLKTVLPVALKGRAFRRAAKPSKPPALATEGTRFHVCKFEFPQRLKPGIRIGERRG